MNYARSTTKDQRPKKISDIYFVRTKKLFTDKDQKACVKQLYMFYLIEHIEINPVNIFLLIIVFSSIVQESLQGRIAMDQQRVEGEVDNDSIILTFRWNATRRVYEMHRHRRGDNNQPPFLNEDWDMRIYTQNDHMIFRENSNNRRVRRIRIGEGESGSGNSITCTICLEEFPVGLEVIQLPRPCCHMYHQDCIIRWLRNSNTCPLCRRPVS